jgi:hypothetical protein
MEKIAITDELIKEMRNSLYRVDHNAVADTMDALLKDPDVSTYDMWEDLTNAYANGNTDVRKGIDTALNILLWGDISYVYQCIKNNHCFIEDRKE